MRKSLTIKMLLRSPMKTLLTFLLIVAASFALFSRVTDYAVTGREATKVRDSYYGVAALDNRAPYIFLTDDENAWMQMFSGENTEWPSEEQLEEFASLPGVTLADTRYMTAGLIEDYKRLHSVEDNMQRIDWCVIEGTYNGYEEIVMETGEIVEGEVTLKLDDAVMLAGEMDSEVGRHVEIVALTRDMWEKNPYPKEYFDSLEKGTRCLVVAYSLGGRELVKNSGEKDFCILDGAGEDYLDTEEFSYYKGLVDAINLSVYTHDIVYTADTRAIPRFNGGGMEIARGRGLRAGDADACVVNELLLDTYGLSIGDRISVRLGDRLFHQSGQNGTRVNSGEEISDFSDAVELEIVGAYRILDSADTRNSESEWSYSQSTVFVPDSLLSAEIPADYETAAGEFSVLIEDAGDIRAFREAAEPAAEEMGVSLVFSDGGWLAVERSFEDAQAAMLLTTALYLAGAGLALLLAVYLFVGRNGQAYAVMRAMGVPGKKAGTSIIFPFAVLSALAMPIGGIVGVSYVADTAGSALGDMAEGMSNSYVPDTALPAGAVFVCIILELAYVTLTALFFLRKMKKTPPLELLAGQHSAGRKPFREKTAYYGTGDRVLKTGTSVLETGGLHFPDGYDVTKLPSAGEMPECQRHSAFRHTAGYSLRHIRRDVGRTAVSILLAAVLLAGIGMSVLSRVKYQDMFLSVDVEGKALQYTSESVTELSKSDLMDNFYYYGSFNVCINGLSQNAPMVFTNDMERYLSGGCTVSYADGYDSSSMEGTGPLCLVSSGIAERLGINPGDKISLLPYDNYLAWESGTVDKEKLDRITREKTREFLVVGIVETNDARAGIFANINYSAETLYGQPFPIEHTEFTLSDNRRLEELEELLQERKREDRKMYSPLASFRIDTAKFEDIGRLCGLLESVFPIAVASALFMGLFGPGLVMMQSVREAALLRVLGVTKKRARCMLVFEQILLCMTGILLAGCGLYLYSPALFARSAQTLAICFVLYFLGCFCGAAAASVHMTRGRIMELLQVKE